MLGAPGAKASISLAPRAFAHDAPIMVVYGSRLKCYKNVQFGIFCQLSIDSIIGAPGAKASFSFAPCAFAHDAPIMVVYGRWLKCYKKRKIWYILSTFH